MHVADDVAPTADECFPPAHKSQLWRSSLSNLPATQVGQDRRFAESCVPPGQGVQIEASIAPTAVEIFPSLQSGQLWRLLVPYLPGVQFTQLVRLDVCFVPGSHRMQVESVVAAGVELHLPTGQLVQL